MKKRNATQTKELILNVATNEFSKYGYDGLRVDDLAARAGVNKATIYYHFKDKSFLYQTILFDMSQFILDNVHKKLIDKKTAQEKLEAFLDAVVFVVTNKRDVAKILMQELSFNGKNFSDEVKAEFFKIVAILIGILKEGKETKVFRDVDPFLIHATTVGGINYYLSMQELAQNEDKDRFPISFKENGVNDIKEMILNYVKI